MTFFKIILEGKIDGMRGSVSEEEFCQAIKKKSESALQ